MDRGTTTTRPGRARAGEPSTDGMAARKVDDAEAVLTVDELAELLRVNRKTVYEAYRRGEIPGGRRIGRSIRFARSIVVAWLRGGDKTPSPRKPRRAP